MDHSKITVCRVCLRSDLDPVGVSNIFDKVGNVFIYEKLNTIAEVHIKPEDGLPEKICGNCLLELDNAINFKQKCETSNSILVSAANTDIGLKLDNADLTDVVKSEPEEDAEYLEDGVWSPTEAHIKSDPDSQSEDTEQQPPPAKKSRAIDLKLECHDCGGSFKSKCKLKVHWKKVHLKEQLTCPICRKTFGSFKTRKEHDIKGSRRCRTFRQVSVTGEGKKQVLHCKECKYSTSSINIMFNHLVKHTGERNYSCQFCPKVYSQFSGLQCHMESAHGTAKQRICKLCGEQITGRTKYNIHLRRHRYENAYVTCEICKKKVKKPGLKQHMDIHSDMRMFACEKCPSTYKTFSALWAHNRRVHQDIKHYKCHKCEYTSKQWGCIKRHQSRHTENNCPCTTCGKFFENEYQLSLHTQQHTDRQQCPQCDSTFYRRKNLLVHINKIHKTYVVSYK